jgi:hypothetical protein
VLVVLFLSPNMWSRLTGEEVDEKTPLEADLSTAAAD